MKNFRYLMLLGVTLLLAFIWIAGCTGEGVYDVTPAPTSTVSPVIPSPTVTSTSSPTASPTSTGGGQSHDREELVTGRNNIFDLRLVDDYIYWVERSSVPQGAIYRAKLDGNDIGKVEKVITGLQLPSAMDVMVDLGSTYHMFVGQGNGSGVITRIELDGNDYPSQQISEAVQGDIIYMAISGYVFYTVDAGGTDSSVMRVDPFPNTPPEIPLVLDSNVNSAYGIKLGALTKEFLLVTERQSSGRVLLYQEPGGDELPITPLVVATSQQQPTKLLYRDDYVYWTNFHSSNGQVMRQKLKYNTSKKKIELDGKIETVAQSLLYPYDIIFMSPNKLLVSSNRTEADGGNWYQIDISNPNKFPLEPSDSQINNLLKTPAEFPFNGILSGTDFFFTSFKNPTGNNDGLIYYSDLSK